MPKKATPLDYWSTAGAMWMLAVETNTVMAMRMMGMAGTWPIPKSEPTKMLMEKPEAFGRSVMAATIAAATGKRPDQITRSAIRPLRRKTKANVRRLTKKALG